MKLSQEDNATGYKYNLAVGNPEFLQEYWMSCGRQSLLVESTNCVSAAKSFNYDFSAGREDLISVIKELHYKEHGLLDIDSRHVVLGNGATQLINVLLSIYKVRGFNSLQARSTRHYPVFKSMAALNGMSFINDLTYAKDNINIYTSPNNPDGKLAKIDQEDNLGIMDLSYMWKTYFNYNDRFDTSLLNRDNPLVFSFSKAFGLPSTRVGWILTKDAELAKAVSEAVEVMSGQVSYEAQQRAFSLINYEVQLRPSYSLFKYGQDELQRRWSVIRSNSFIQLNTDILSERGMFLLLREKGLDAQTMLDAKGISGSHFGALSDDIRFNIGCSSRVFKAVFSE